MPCPHQEEHHICSPDGNTSAKDNGADIRDDGHYLFPEVAAEISQDSYFEVGIFLYGKTAPDIDCTNKAVPGQFLRPVKRIVQHIAAKNLNGDDKNHRRQTEAGDDFFCPIEVEFYFLHKDFPLERGDATLGKEAASGCIKTTSQSERLFFPSDGLFYLLNEFYADLVAEFIIDSFGRFCPASSFFFT